MTKSKPKRCDCPVYCRYCGRKRSRDAVGHYCKTRNCQWEHGYKSCTLNTNNKDSK
jgi:hypothetical protein